MGSKNRKLITLILIHKIEKSFYGRNYAKMVEIKMKIYGKSEFVSM